MQWEQHEDETHVRRWDAVEGLRLWQEWLDQRLDDFATSAVGGQYITFCTENLRPREPARWSWHTFLKEVDTSVLLTQEEQAAARGVLVICNTLQAVQVSRLRCLLRALSDVGQTLPPVILMPHTVPPDLPSHQRLVEGDASDGGVLSDPTCLGAEDILSDVEYVLAGEPRGWDLALAIRAGTRHAEHQVEAVAWQAEAAKARAERHARLSQQVDYMMWDWLPTRLRLPLPACDNSIEHGIAPRVGGRQLGQLLGSGGQGSVYRLLPRAGEPEDCVKVVPKAKFRSAGDLQALGHMLAAMRTLSDLRHPGLIQVHEVQQSATHLYFRCEFGGPESLYRWLCSREGAERPWSTARTASVAEQMLSAVLHLHLAARLCHRDIKPENVVVRQRGRELAVKLADFDTLARGSRPCASPCGTVPFAAPEVFCGRYDGQLADVWSLGVVLLEVFCKARVIETALELGTSRCGQPSSEVQEKILAAASTPGFVASLLAGHVRPEAQALLLPGTFQRRLVANTLVPQVAQRWSPARIAGERDGRPRDPA